jgi:hypothetical protein
LTATKVKVYNLEYDVKNLQKEEFNPKDTIVIKNLSLPLDGDEEKQVKEVLNYLEIEEIDTAEDFLAVARKGNSQDRLGSVFVKLVYENMKKQIMKKKNNLRNHVNSEVRDLKIMNFKAQEHILPNGDRYELNGNMRLVTKQI